MKGPVVINASSWSSLRPVSAKYHTLHYASMRLDMTAVNNCIPTVSNADGCPTCKSFDTVHEARALTRISTCKSHLADG